MSRTAGRWKSGLATLLALVMLLGLLPVSAFAADTDRFSDTAGHWGESAIDRVVKEGLFNGISDTSFDPNGGMSRAMFVTVLYRLADKLDGPAPLGAGQSFTDVEGGAWYADAVAWAVRAGITTGYGDGRFGPNDLVTREQLCVFLVRFLSDYMGYDLSGYTAGAAFADDAGISSWAKSAVYLAQALGLVQGVGANKFNPKDTATRASVAAIADRLLDKTGELNRPGETPKPTPSPKPSGGGGGGGSGTVALTGVYILRGTANVTGQPLRSGDVLAPYVSPVSSIYTVRWLVGGVEKSTSSVYTVAPLDAGQTITVEATGASASGYTGTVTSAATGAVTAVVDVTDPSSPVKVDPGASYVDGDGNPVASIPADAELTLAVSKSADPAPTAEAEALKITVGGQTVTPDVVVMDVNLTMTEADGTSTGLHPVGTTTVTLSKAALGLPTDADLSLYTFNARHTNKAGTPETVTGTVVTIGGIDYVQFELNGLSRIYIGNVPPLTVTFNTDGGSAVASQKVKLGQRVVAPANPTKTGWLFAGWDYGFNTQIIADTTFTAQWVQGSYVPNSRLSASGGLSDVTPEKQEEGKGTLQITLSADGIYALDTAYTVVVQSPEDAAKYAVADTAQAAAEADSLTSVPGNSQVSFTAAATDSDGRAIPGRTTKYFKWVDAQGNVLAVEAASFLVKTGSGAENRTETKDVDRGIGTFEVMLTGAQGKEDYYAYLNNSGLTRGDDGGYTLEVRASLDENRHGARVSDYSALQVVFAPFAGETYSGAPTASASYWDRTADRRVTVPVSAAIQADGKLAVTTTGSIAALTGADDYVNLDLTVGVGGRSQNINFSLHVTNDTMPEYVTAPTWAEVVAALGRSGAVQVSYTGAQDITLTGPLTLAVDKELDLGGKNLTIGQGGVLTLSADNKDSAGLYDVNALTVADGGLLTTNAQNERQGSYYHGYVDARSITVARGGRITVPALGLMNLNAAVTVAAGSSIDNSGILRISGDTVIAGTLSVTGADMEYQNSLYGDTEIRGAATISGTVTLANKGGFYAYGGGTVTASGRIDLQSGWVELTGDVENSGTLNVTGGELKLDNMGFSIANSGTITIAAGADVYAWGTVLVNTGAISGAGTLNIAVADDTSSYDDGIERALRVGNTDTPSDYTRNKFTHDPAATVEVTYFAGKLSNQDSGACTAVINDTTV